MGKCNACGNLHPYPGEHTCRFYKEAKEKARIAGNEDSWCLNLDIDTLEELQAAEEGKSEALKGGDIKPPALPKTPEEQVADLTRRMDQLADQMHNFLSLHVQSAAPATMTTQPPLQMAAASVPSVTTSTATALNPAVTTTSPATSGLGPSLCVAANPVHTTASTMGQFQVSTTSGVWTSAIPHMPLVSSQPRMSYQAVGGSSLGSTPRPGHVLGPTSSPAPSQPGIFSVNPMAPSSWLPDPLTTALQQLSNAVDPDASNRNAGMLFRPEYYALHKLNNIPVRQLDHRRMSFKQLMYGMTCVAQHVRSSGYDIDGYLSHVEFISRHVSDDSYIDSAYADYDKFVIDNFLKSPISGFRIADSVAIGHAFHPAKLNSDYREKVGVAG